tara:strand:- start:175 stop:588 length:414 start_codon:yes stop_codon:yes gene_type:complete
MRIQPLKIARRSAAYTLEEIMMKLSLPAAVLSPLYDGSYLNRVSGPLQSIYDIGKSFIGDILIQNTPSRDILFQASTNVMSAFGDVGHNLADDPAKVGYAALATFVAWEAVPRISRGIRKHAIPAYRRRQERKEVPV